MRALIIAKAAVIAAQALSVFASEACDVAEPLGIIDNADVQAAIRMMLGSIRCPSTAGGNGVCNAAFVQRVVNASIAGGVCTSAPDPTPRYILLTWNPSPSPAVRSYHVYRSTASGGPYVRLTASPVTMPFYADASGQPGQTYYYVTTAVTDQFETEFSNEASATVPVSGS